MIWDAGVDTRQTNDVLGAAPSDTFSVCTTMDSPSELTVTWPSSFALDVAFPGYKSHHPEVPFTDTAHPL